MSLRKFIISRAFLMHLSIAIVVVALLFFATFKSLQLYTQHGISYSVPALTGLQLDEATESAGANKLRVEVIDSVYNKNFEPGSVVDQLPLANSRVKANRVIKLTINSNEPEKITLPRLTDISYRQAQVLIESIGLQVINTYYQPSEYTDLVLSVMQDSVEIFEGDKIIKGSGIDLVVGRSQGNMRTTLPNLTGFTLDEARSTVADALLNMGAVIYDNTIKTGEDSINARIWKQLPNPKFTKQIEMGSSVDIWLTTDTVMINDAYERTYR
ncbi:PASTA domain-containing protein [Draconibacterium sp. IB214405]|uniref:PASTA domain-containing protein n=1 Tax=Draconibacterium sp. IB214405 TaxID=3097352 RepID=UPI002A1351C4|nr:PASTA domain-containing protein [Draconibacterium sp. IB214405]MDX8340810.1 PASTA domain-containing protein [Draconibacterium sp. IB214405]